MAQELDAGAVQLLRLFKGEKEFVSPMFQRRYVWSDKEIKKLWEDIDGILDGTAGTRFLGALVLEVRAAGRAFKPDSMWIVDGQQRITTLYMALLRIAIEAEKHGATELATFLHGQYLFNQHGDDKYKPKLQPTLLDYKQFRELFDEISSFQPKLQPSYGDELGSLRRSQKQIRSAILKRCFDDNGQFSDQKARELVGALLEKLKFVQIVLGEEEDPHQVFDSLNARGVRLENKDLIRNIIFERASDNPAEAQSIYNGQWLPFEQNLGDRLDDFFFPFSLIHKSTITKANLLNSLRERWTDKEPTEIISDLKEYVPVFDAITSPDENALLSITESTDLSNRITRLRRMRVPSSTYPFLMRLLREYQEENISETEVSKNLAQLESFLVRRAIAGFEPTGLHAVFKDLWNKTNGNAEKFIKQIDENPTIHFPDDDTFKHDIREKPLYGRRLAPYVLMEYERGLRGGDPVPEIEPTMDHVMPQELSAAWEGVVSAEDHKTLKDTWANLVPLSLPANAEKGQKAWTQVREYFNTETVFKTTKRLAQQHANWDANAIRERAEQLALWAVDRWPKQA